MQNVYEPAIGPDKGFVEILRFGHQFDGTQGGWVVVYQRLEELLIEVHIGLFYTDVPIRNVQEYALHIRELVSILLFNHNIPIVPSPDTDTTEIVFIRSDRLCFIYHRTLKVI